MHKLFPTCLLVQDGSEHFELEFTEVNLHPGNGFSPDQGESIVLAGGFSSITPESGFPLSSTLQLNLDLAVHSSIDLAAIARAELRRSSAVNFRSYTVEADMRVCVLGDNAGQINAFVDSYGGVLEIEPLLVKGSDPEIPTATELNISIDDQGCRLAYQVRSPIDFKLCGYCGDCGPACPEQCISERLFVDFKSCTFCKACEQVCTAGAIDIHSALAKVLEVPAIIILGDFRVELPDGEGRVFYADDLADYFATLFPCQIDEVITWNKGLCQFSGNLGHGCDLCLSSCPHYAIVQDGRGVTVDSLRCEECGACVASCPTGALQNERFNDRTFVDYFQEVPVPRDGTVIVGDENSLHALWWRQRGKKRENMLFLQYDKVHSLSLFHFLFLVSHGARRIVVLEGEGERRSFPAAEKQRALANEILGRLYSLDDAVACCTVDAFATLMNAPLTGSFANAALSADFAADFAGDFINRRQSLASALAALAAGSGREASLRSQARIPFATVRCNSDRCTQCMACLNDCRIGAMQADQQQLTLNHQGVLCVGCGLCVRICPERALSISPEFTLNNNFFMPIELAKADPMACKHCGKVFGTRKSFERVMAILSQKESVDTNHLEYCDTCRVVKFFAAE